MENRKERDSWWLQRLVWRSERTVYHVGNAGKMEVDANFRDESRIKRSRRRSTEIAEILIKKREISPNTRKVHYMDLDWLIDCMCEYFCTACYKIFKCVFLDSEFFKLVHVISQVLVDRLTWNLKEIFNGCTFIARTTDFKIWCFLYFFFLPPKRRKIQGKSIF